MTFPYTYPHLIPSKPPDQFGRGICEECGAPVSTYTEPQPVTSRRLCNRHWRLPDGYYISGSGRIVKEADRAS